MANVDRELVSAVEEALKLNAKSVSDTRIVKSTSGVTSIPVVNESGEVVRVPMDIMGAKTVLFKDINSLTDPYTSCGEYIVTDGITILGIMTVTTQWSPHTIYQKITTTATLEGLNSMEGLEVPTMSYIGLNDYVRYYNVTNKTWSVWQEYNLKLDDSVITSWGGTIVENPKINSQSSTANGKVVLAKMDDGKMGFVWEVTASDGTKSYYNNWIEGSNYSGFSNYQDTPFDGTKQVEIKRTIFITPENGTYLCLNGREVTNIDSLENIAKSVKWSGEIVNGVTISQNSYTGDDGAVVLVGNYTFAYKVGSTYYGNWTTREDYQKNIYKSGTIGWKAGFYDYLLYVSPTSVWMKKSDSELVNISSEGSGGGSDALLLGDINSLTDSSTSSQIATALNNKTLAELQDAVRNGASIQFVGDYGVVDIIHKSQSIGQLVFGFVYTDEPVYAPYMSKIIALEYTNGNWTCKVREDVDLSSGGSGGGSDGKTVHKFKNLYGLTSSSTSYDIMAALNLDGKTFDELRAIIKKGTTVVDETNTLVMYPDVYAPVSVPVLVFIYRTEITFGYFATKQISISYSSNYSVSIREDNLLCKQNIVNNLTAIGEGFALDARQGKVLKELIDSKEGGDAPFVLGDLSSLTNNSTSAQIATVLNGNSFDDIYDAINNDTGRRFVYLNTSTKMEIIGTDTSYGSGDYMVVFYFLLRDTSLYRYVIAQVTIGQNSTTKEYWCSIDNKDSLLSAADIVNNLTSTATNKPLSAAQGKVLKDLIDAGGSGGSDNTIYLKNIQNLEDTSTHDQILAVLNGNSFLDMYRKINDDEKISIVSLGTWNTSINQFLTSDNGSEWQIAFYYVYSDDPASAPYMTRNVWLSYNKVSSQLKCDIQEELQFQVTTQGILRENLPTGTIIKDKLVRGGNHTIPTGFYLNGLEVYGSFLIGSVSYSYYAKAKNIVNGVNLLTDVTLTGSGAPTIMLITCEFNYDDNHVGWVDSALQIVDIGGTTLTPTSVVHHVDVEYIKS